jgi:hypothetical protein
MASLPFHRADIVRIARLAEDERDVDGTLDPPRQPRIGEIGTIVDQVGDDIYLVERCTDDGRTLWIAEFLAAELVLVTRGLRTED